MTTTKIQRAGTCVSLLPVGAVAHMIFSRLNPACRLQRGDDAQ